MIAKSDDLRRSLREIDHLLQALRAADVDSDVHLDEIELLERSRRSIVTLLAARQTQNREKVVALQAWRDGSLIAPPFTAEHHAAMAQTSRPQPGAPRPYRVS
ncbi:MAG: hypothetical protein KGL11_12435 [Alphaproteobacteria bacterium]|nr:hypothetical protein [Alphaproteobacteria bacterium]